MYSMHVLASTRLQYTATFDYELTDGVGVAYVESDGLKSCSK